MPLVTKVTRDDKVVKFDRGWDYPMLSMFLTVALQEQYADWEFREGLTIGDLEKDGKGKFCDFSMAPIYYMDIPIDLWTKGKQTLTRDHTFGPFEDGSTVEFKKGDILKMWRESR